jgi:flagellin
VGGGASPKRQGCRSWLKTKEGFAMSRIVTNSSANLVYMYYQQNNSTLSSSLEKLSSGLQINRASDDPAGLAISENERLQTNGANAANNVIANANNFINTADGYLQTVNDMLGQMEQLAVSYNDSTKSGSDQTDLTDEFTALENEMNNITSQSEFNSVQLFQATGSNLTFQVGADSADIFNIATTGTITSMVSTLAINNITAIQAATQSVASTRANLGADQIQLNYQSTAQMNYSTNISAAESRIRDVDVAQEATDYAKDQILVQSSTAMLAQSNASPQNVLMLLQG